MGPHVRIELVRGNFLELLLRFERESARCEAVVMVGELGALSFMNSWVAEADHADHEKVDPAAVLTGQAEQVEGFGVAGRLVRHSGTMSC